MIRKAHSGSIELSARLATAFKFMTVDDHDPKYWRRQLLPPF